jgi:hypothetical protein
MPTARNSAAPRSCEPPAADGCFPEPVTATENPMTEMKLIGAGLPRTATSSQKAAMDVLGLDPCYHMQNVFADLDEAVKWRAALDSVAALEDVVAGSVSVIDWPGTYHWRTLMDIYPDAKVMLSVRSGESWARSMQQTIWGMLWGDGLLGHVTRVHTDVDPRYAFYIETMKTMWRRAGLADERSTVASMASAMEAYNRHVIETVPAERLLVWQIGDGWEPICAFMGLPVPAQPFPHINDSAGFETGIVRFALSAIHGWLGEDAVGGSGHPGASPGRETAGA